MRQGLFLLLIVLMAVFGLGQDGGIDFVLQAGLASDQELNLTPLWGVATLQMVIHLNDFLSLAPECSLWAPDLKFKPFTWSPGITANYKFGTLFIGGGILRLIQTDSNLEHPLRTWLIKAHTGFWVGSFAMTAFLLMDRSGPAMSWRMGVLMGVLW